MASASACKAKLSNPKAVWAPGEKAACNLTISRQAAKVKRDKSKLGGPKNQGNYTAKQVKKVAPKQRRKDLKNAPIKKVVLKKAPSAAKPTKISRKLNIAKRTKRK